MLPSEEYKKYYATFYLKKRSKARRWLSDPVEREYRWWIAYFCTTRSDMERRMSAWRPYGGRSRGFYRHVVDDPEAEAVLPAHSPSYYLEFAGMLGGEVTEHVREVRVIEGRKNRKIQVSIPVIKFENVGDMYKHILFSATLATFRNPSLYAPRVAVEILRRPSWSEMLGLGCTDRFREVRSANYTSTGFWWVLRIGMAFNILSKIKTRSGRRSM